MCLLQGKNIRTGADQFWLYVGPYLLVAGGFYDGKQVIAEPLGDICIMLKDDTLVRCEKLARVLYALASGIGKLKKYIIVLSSITCLISGFQTNNPAVF